MLFVNPKEAHSLASSDVAFTLQQQLSDDVDDAIGSQLRAFHAVPSWTQDKHALYWAMESAALDQGYMPFSGDSRDYLLERKGSSCLFDVPLHARGALKWFAGQRVRLICAGAWDQYSGRYYLVNVVASEPLKQPSHQQQDQG